jgi:thiamine-monophosphate kinase
MHTPVPRVELGVLLAEQGIAHAAIDISDGLIGDLGHILKLSQVGATLDVDALPAGEVLATQDRPAPRLHGAGGDDYELCFTAPPRRAGHPGAAASVATPVTRVGASRPQAACGWWMRTAALDLQLAGFDHFTS